MKAKKIFMKSNYKANKKTMRSRFTRMCIGEAIVELLQTMELEELRVSAIAKRAGISRMTFYYYYDSALAALKDYMKEVISSYLSARKKTPGLGSFQEYSHLVFSLKYFDGYERFFTTMTKRGLHSILMNGINEFMLSYLPVHSQTSLYDVYYYAGGLLNVFLKWQESGKKESAEEVAEIICRQIEMK